MPCQQQKSRVESIEQVSEAPSPLRCYWYKSRRQKCKHAPQPKKWNQTRSMAVEAAVPSNMLKILYPSTIPGDVPTLSPDEHTLSYHLDNCYSLMMPEGVPRMSLDGHNLQRDDPLHAGGLATRCRDKTPTNASTISRDCVPQ